MHKTSGVPDQQSKTRLHWLERSLKLNYWPTTIPIVPGCSKLCLAAFHLGHTPYGGSNVPCRFLSLNTLWRSHFRPYRGTSWPGWLGHFVFRWLGVRGQEPRQRVTVWHRFRWWILHLLKWLCHTTFLPMWSPMHFIPLLKSYLLSEQFQELL